MILSSSLATIRESRNRWKKSNLCLLFGENSVYFIDTLPTSAVWLRKKNEAAGSSSSEDVVVIGEEPDEDDRTNNCDHDRIRSAFGLNFRDPPTDPTCSNIDELSNKSALCEELTSLAAFKVLSLQMCFRSSYTGGRTMGFLFNSLIKYLLF